MHKNVPDFCANVKQSKGYV